MFSLGDYVWYGKNGVCKVTEIYERPEAPKPGPYYRLIPVDMPRCRISIPVDCDENCIRPAYSRAQAVKQLKAIETMRANVITEESDRILALQEGSEQFDPVQWYALIKGVYIIKADKESKGKRLRPSESDALKKALTLIAEEFALALERDVAPVKEELIQALQQNI